MVIRIHTGFEPYSPLRGVLPLHYMSI